MKTTGMCVVLLAMSVTATGVRAEEPEAIKLFNGKDLTNWYTYLRDRGKNDDPKEVFTIQDGILRISGEEYGCITTEKEYENYRIILEFKWGEETFAPRKDRTRDSGLLLHCIGEDGAAGGVWKESIECQMIEGGTGDFIMVAGKGKRPVLTAKVEERGGQWYYAPKSGTEMERRGRVNWWGRSPEWKDVKGFRGEKDVEKPVGEWNRLECVCDGDTITNILNGVVVNKGTKVFPTKGQIQVQSEGAELFIRRIDLVPLK